MCLELRPHHGLCLLFYAGRGYSAAFTARMNAVSAALERNPVLRLASGPDTLCAACPHLGDGSCGAKAARYDRQVLALGGLAAGQALPWRALAGRLRAAILSPRRLAEVCGDCQWSSICLHASRIKQRL